ncbi:MAG: replication-associated recombination protein A, partial [Paracoccaceae bacterium]
MPDLFDSFSDPTPPAGRAPRPLADRIRPARLSEVIGQARIMGPEGPLGAMLAAGRLSSLILW